jgi:hypothetical protein
LATYELILEQNVDPGWFVYPRSSRVGCGEVDSVTIV